MRRIFTTLLILLSTATIAQEAKWNRTLEPQKVFIENKSQFTGKCELLGSDVLFATEDGPVQVLFTKKGLIYKLEQREHPEVDERELRKEGMTHEELEEKEHGVEIKTDILRLEWKNSNATEVIARDEFPGGYSYHGESGSIHARAFRKIVYLNLYPNIDVEYVFHPGSGIEYSFILHPGSDVANIQMAYSDVSGMGIDKENDIHFPTQFGDIIDHAPVTFYSGSNIAIASHFVRHGKTISFALADYDLAKEIIIDPWTVFPSMGSSNKIFNVEADSSGNAYIYGGDSPYKLQKYDPTGNLLWTFTNGWDSSTYWCGTLIVDRAGNSFITAGSSAEITKVNTGGGQVWTNSGGIFDEYWSMAFNCDETELIVGGTRLTGIPIITGSGRAYNIDLNSGNVINSIKVADAIPSFIFNDPNEIRSVCASPNGNYYFLTLDTIGELAPALAGINWESLSSYRFGYGSPNYGFTPQGQSIIRASATHIYTANGDSVVKRDINTGIIVAAAAIPGGGHATTFLVPGTLPKNGGLAIDSCGNVFVGSQSNVTMYDANLNFISSTATPSAVYDVAIGTNGDVLASGNGFAVALTIPSCSQIHISCNTAVLPVASFSAPNTICPGTCTGYTNLSSNATAYQWYFPGALPATSTDVDPSNICYNTPGTYDVTLVAGNAAGTDSITLLNYITVFPYLPPQGISQNGDTLSANQGSTSYQWYQDGILIPGATDYFFVLAQGGNYNVVCTDNNGCEVEAVIFDVVAGVDGNSNSIPALEVFPNPSSDKITVRTNLSGISFPLSVYNVLGEKMLLLNPQEKNLREFSFDIGNLSPDVYWLELISGNKIYRIRFVKSNYR
ncbi:MAG: T9SS type A sorting domain-containing protein [Bacteroidota bacterium]